MISQHPAARSAGAWKPSKVVLAQAVYDLRKLLP